jgi:hypothetical protein
MVSKLGVHKSSSELADLETSAIRLIWKEVGEATRAKKQWMDARADPDEGNFLARVWHLFKKDSGESLKLQTGVPEDYQGARTIEDRILSLNPKRAVLYVVTKMFT